MSLENFSDYLKHCSDDNIWEPFFNDEDVVYEFNKLIELIEDSKNWDRKRNHEKGKLLEELVKIIMSRFTILDQIKVNKSTKDNEMDIFVNFNDLIPIPFLCSIKSKMICECKNWASKSIDVGMVSKLVELCEKNDAGLGIFISLKGLSGKGWQYAEGKRRKLYLSNKMPIISFTIDEIECLKYKGFNLLTMIKCKRQALIDEMEYTGGELKEIESDFNFLENLNENIENLRRLNLINQEEYENITRRIKTKYQYS
ncbi:MAG: restriction endonuclease [Peptostreptococcaceae bacterium]